MLQLHGKETVARIRDIKQKFGLPVMKAIGVETAPISRRCPAMPPSPTASCSMRMPPKEATRPGGLGVPFDWRLLENLALELPFMLSGGLSAATSPTRCGSPAPAVSTSPPASRARPVSRIPK